MSTLTHLIDINASKLVNTTSLNPRLGLPSSTNLFSPSSGKLGSLGSISSITGNPTSNKGFDFATASSAYTNVKPLTPFTSTKTDTAPPPTVRLTSSASITPKVDIHFKDDSLNWSSITNNTKPTISTTTVDSIYSPTRFTDINAPTSKIGLSTSSFDSLVKAGTFDAPLSPSKLVVDTNSGSVLNGTSFNTLINAGIYDATLSPTRFVGPVQGISPSKLVDAPIKYAGDTSIFGPVEVGKYDPSKLAPLPEGVYGPAAPLKLVNSNPKPIETAYKLTLTSSGTYTLTTNSLNNTLSTANNSPTSPSGAGATNYANPYQTNAMVAEHRQAEVEDRILTRKLDNDNRVSQAILMAALASTDDAAALGTQGAWTSAPSQQIAVNYV